MNIKTFVFLGILIGVCFTLNGQNNNTIFDPYVPTPPHPELFKYLPQVDANTPSWALTMYSENPNVEVVIRAYQAHYKTHEFQKTIHTQNYKHWLRVLNLHNYISADGFVKIPSQKVKDQQWEAYLEERKNKNSAGNWSLVGPLETKQDGNSSNAGISAQVNVYTFDQSISDPNTLFCGSETGGVFKSTDKGTTWTSVGNTLNLGGIGSVKIDPTNEDIVYVGQGSKLYKTTDGGANWTEIYSVSSLNTNDISINPSNTQIVMLATAKGLYRSIDGGTNFTQLYSEACWDIEIKPNDNTIVYVLKSNSGNTSTEFYKSTDSGATFTLKDSGWYSPIATSTNGGARMTVTPADNDRIYVALLGNDVSYAQDVNWIGVYKSTDAGETWTLPAGDPGGPYSSSHLCISTFNPNATGTYDQGYYNLGIAASHSNADHFLLGCLNLFKSEDGAATFTQWGGYGGGDGTYQHPDIQDLEINGSDTWVCSDGGIDLYNSNFNGHTAKNDGISGSQFWGFDSGWNEDLLVGGRYHNGNTAWYETYPAGDFLRLGGGEAATGYVNIGQSRTAYFSDISSTVVPSSITGSITYFSKLNKYPNESYFNENKSEIERDPRCYNHFYLGSSNVLWKSEDTGNSFTSIYTFGSDTDHTLTDIEISRLDPNVMYVVQKVSGASKIWKTTDGGSSWNELSLPSSNTGGGIFISLKPGTSNSLWIAISVGGTSTQKIYKTENGGSSWVNYSTTALDGKWNEDIMAQGGTNETVYLATNLGIYYRNGTHSDWQDFNTNLPAKFSPLEMRPFYKDGKLRIATGNRGIWETAFADASTPVAQPTVDKLHATCSRDTFYFDDYSIMNHAGATWAWTFTPSPTYVSSNSVRNPKVVFGANGTYSASLTVTQGGNNSSKTLTDIITINSQCEAENYPGNAMTLSSSGDYARMPNLDMGSQDNVTFSAWIKPNGSQPDYTGIVMGDEGGSFGMNIRPGQKLAYHWKGGGVWWWESGLTIPSDEWSHVAIVRTPTAITVYLNGVGATHTVSTSSIDFSNVSMYLGSYMGWGSRNFNGDIDEVCIWKKALTQNEIREQMNLTKVPANDSDLAAYYQFNLASGTSVMDKVSVQHATLQSGASRSTSTIPCGGGSSNRQTVTSGGITVFTGTDVTMEFPASGTYPNGELLVSKINVAPDQSPGANPVPTAGYWVIHNFGTNSTFSELTSILFENLSGIIITDLTQYGLHKRASNAIGNTWGNAIDLADAATVSSLTYSTSNSITSFSQFVINKGSALPIELLKFSAHLTNDKEVLLDWKTASEINSDYFEIQSTTDGTNFEKIGLVESRGDEQTEITAYTFLDKTPARGTNYYRLKQVDNDGAFEYSEIRSLVLQALPVDFLVFPNPLASQNELHLQTNLNEPYQFSIFNAEGKRIFRDNLEGDVVLENLDLAPGFYFYRMQTVGKIISGKIVVKGRL